MEVTRRIGSGSAATGDLDGTGGDEVALARFDDEGDVDPTEVGVYRYDGSGFSPIHVVLLEGTEAYAAVIDDLNGDGCTDLLLVARDLYFAEGMCTHRGADSSRERVEIGNPGDAGGAVKKQDQQKATEEIEALGSELVDNVRRLVREGNVRRVIIRREDGTSLLEVPLTGAVAVGGAVTLFAPVLAALGALAALVSSCKIEVIRDHPDDEA